MSDIGSSRVECKNARSVVESLMLEFGADSQDARTNLHQHAMDKDFTQLIYLTSIVDTLTLWLLFELAT